MRRISGRQIAPRPHHCDAIGVRRPGEDDEKPKITDYGDLRELTAAHNKGTKTDVPLGTAVPPFTIFSY